MGKIVVTDRAGETHEIEMEVGDNLMEPLRELDDGIEALVFVGAQPEFDVLIGELRNQVPVPTR